MTDRLQQMNGALQLLGQTRLASLSEPVKARRELDAVWDETNLYLLSQGLWNFAIRSSELTYDEDVQPLSGYRYAFTRPEDFVRIVSISAWGFGEREIERYQQETDYWFCDYDRLYVRYVSDDPEYGMDMSRWTPAFCEAHQSYLAYKAGLAITGDAGKRSDAWSLHKTHLRDAKTLDAVEQPIARQPSGSWGRARFANGSRRRG